MSAWVRVLAGFAVLVVAALLLKQLPALAVLTLLVGGLAYTNAKLKPRDAKDTAAQEARALGLERSGPEEVTRLPLVLLERGDDAVVTDVLTGTWSGLEASAFRLSLRVTPPDGVRRERRLGCAIARLGSGGRALVVEPLAFLLPFSDGAPRPATEGIGALEGSYAVRCDDPGFARSVLGGPILDRLARNDAWGFELGDGWALAYGPTERLEALDALEALRGFVDGLPSELRPARSA